MIDITKAEIENIIIHKVGNKGQEEGCLFSETEATPSEYLKTLLTEHYLRPLSEVSEPSIFYHESDLELNAIAQFSESLFNAPESFKEQSIKIAKHLYSVSNHPNIAGGEFIVILFSNIVVGSANSMGLAVLKVESKDDYLDIRNENGTLELIEKEGIALREIQKGALILSSDMSVLAIDILKRRTKYWHDDFLKVAPKKTEEAEFKASGDILRGLSSRIENPSDHLAFNQGLENYLDQRDELELRDLHDLSKPYLDPQEIDRVFNAAQSKAGFEFDSELKIPSERFRLQAKNVMKKTRIIDGVNLVVTNEDAYLNGIKIEERDGGFRAIIDFDIYESLKEN